MQPLNDHLIRAMATERHAELIRQQRSYRLAAAARTPRRHKPPTASRAHRLLARVALAVR